MVKIPVDDVESFALWLRQQLDFADSKMQSLIGELNVWNGKKKVYQELLEECDRVIARETNANGENTEGT
jgi:hypothetical protein